MDLVGWRRSSGRDNDVRRHLSSRPHPPIFDIGAALRVIADAQEGDRRRTIPYRAQLGALVGVGFPEGQARDLGDALDIVSQVIAAPPARVPLASLIKRVANDQGDVVAGEADADQVQSSPPYELRGGVWAKWSSFIAFGRALFEATNVQEGDKMIRSLGEQLRNAGVMESSISTLEYYCELIRAAREGADP